MKAAVYFLLLVVLALVGKSLAGWGCNDDESKIFGGMYRCEEFIRLKGAAKCYSPAVNLYCCETCLAKKLYNAPAGCQYGDKSYSKFLDRRTKRIFKCRELRDNIALRDQQCRDGRVNADCCYTCRDIEAEY